MTETLTAAPRAPVPGPPQARFPCFDGLRALAASAVAITHVAFISGFNIRNDALGPYAARLDVGVAVFFAVSGFLLYRPFLMARLDDRAIPAFRPYWRRRFLRIYPAYWLAFTLVVFVLPRPVDEVPSLGGMVAHYTLTHIYFVDHVLGPLQQSWSLATEVSFYLFLPLYALVLRRIGRTPEQIVRAELAGVVVLYAASVAFRAWLLAADVGHNGMYSTWLPARTDLFALGMALAVLSAWFATQGRREPAWLSHRAVPYASWGLAFLSFWAVSTRLDLTRGPADFGPSQQMWLQFLYGTTAVFLVLPAVFGPQRRGAIRRFLALGPMMWLGLVSYGIYLWHEAAIDAYLVWFDVEPFRGPAGRMTVLMVAFTLAFAAASWYALERVVLRHKDRPFPRPGRRVTAGFGS